MAADQPEPSDGTPEKKQGLQRFLPIAAIVLGMVLFFAFDLQRFLSFDALRDNRDALQAFVSENAVVAVLIYIGIYTLAVALSVPGALVLTITGGFLFGNVFGTLWAVIGATIGATGIFLAARTALGDTLRKKAGPSLKRMEDGFRENAFNYLLFLRLVPVFPFFIVNLVPAFLGVRVGTFIAATLIGIIPGTFVFAQVGRGLDSVLATGGEPDLSTVLTADVIIALVALAVLSVLPIIVKRIRRKRT
ncbi:MAG: TVP38/TMEM64 family protein [Minwuia sp.]|nr:TVP38/TMEM64 family protein [Minwuia sp.]